MHRNSLALFLVGAILLGLVATAIVAENSEKQLNMVSPAEAPPQPETVRQSEVLWEYKTICVQGPFENAAQTLNEYGKKGWEVIDWEDTGFKQYLLKRQVPRGNPDTG